MKKFFAILTAVVMLLTLACPAFAAGEGTITINQTVAEQDYSVYKMATLVDYDVAKDAYLYTAEAAWVAFFEEYDNFTFDDGFIIYEKNSFTAAEREAFAKAALDYAEANGIGAVETISAEGDTVVFTDLDLGYYLVDSSLGALCALTTTDPTAEIDEKNAQSDINKEVEEDSLVETEDPDDEWGNVNDADTFQTINYRTTITVEKGAENYVLHDKMDAGLTFTGITSVTVNGADVDEANYTLITETDDECTFEISFEDEYIKSLAAETEIIVKYTAVLNENAVIAGLGNVNETWLEYGEDSETTHIKTTTYTYEFDLVKTDAASVLLDGAEFKLYVDGSNTALSFLKDADGYYAVAAGTEGATDTLVVTGGKITVRGLDSDNYSLVETLAPTGYNQLDEAKTFKIEGANLNATITNGKYEDGGVNVVNKTGTILPGTGSMGTTLFLVIGGMIILAAGVVLISKKRMSKIAD